VALKLAVVGLAPGQSVGDSSTMFCCLYVHMFIQATEHLEVVCTYVWTYLSPKSTDAEKSNLTKSPGTNPITTGVAAVGFAKYIFTYLTFCSILLLLDCRIQVNDATAKNGC
jgi:hypothetical protein